LSRHGFAALCGVARDLSAHGRSPRGGPDVGLAGFVFIHGRLPRGARLDGSLALHGVLPRGGPPDGGLALHGLLPRGGGPPDGGLPGSVRGLSPRGGPPGGGLLLQARLPRGAPVDGLLDGRSERGVPAGGLLHGRSPRGAPPAGLSRHGRDSAGGPSFSRSRRTDASLPDHAFGGRFFFLKRSRGSLCAPPGRQSPPRFSAPTGGRFCASRSASGESHSRPRANHFMTTSEFVRRSCVSVGSSSSCSRARNAVGLLSMRMVQYA
jgi:hypothetical protein